MGEQEPSVVPGRGTPDPGVQLAALTESINDAVVSAAGDHGIVFWNAGAKQLLGWERSEAIGQPLTMFMLERFHAAHRSGVARVLAGGERHLIGGGGIEVVARHRDEHEVHVELTVGHFRDAGRDYFTGILRDITRRLRRRQVDAAQDAVRRALRPTRSSRISWPAPTACAR